MCKRPNPGDQALFLEEAHHLNDHFCLFFFLNLMRSYEAKNKYFFGWWRLEGVCVWKGGGEAVGRGVWAY